MDTQGAGLLFFRQRYWKKESFEFVIVRGVSLLFLLDSSRLWVMCGKQTMQYGHSHSSIREAEQQECEALT